LTFGNTPRLGDIGAGLDFRPRKSFAYPPPAFAMSLRLSERETMTDRARYFEGLKVGDRAERATLITEEMVKQFAAFSGDDKSNPCR